MSGVDGQGDPGLSGDALARHVRRHDPDRFLFSLFLPGEIREAAWVLVAFNHELARAIETAGRRENEAGPYPALVRLQWWREIVEGTRRRHEVAGPLGALLDAGRLDPARLEAMIAAREAELAPLANREAWFAMLRGGAGSLAAAMGALAGADAAAQARLVEAGAAYGAGASLRNRAALAAMGRSPFPEAGEDAAAWAAAAREALLPVRPARIENAAALHAVLARRDLARVAAGNPEHGARGVGDRLAVLGAWLRRRG